MEEVDGGGWLEEVDGGGWLEEVDGGGWLEEVDGGGWLEEVDGGGWLEEVDDGGWLEKPDVSNDTTVAARYLSIDLMMLFYLSMTSQIHFIEASSFYRRFS